MDGQSDSLAVAPPRLIPSLAAGFNTVANNIQLILFPVILDLLLWVGPHLRIKILFSPVIQDYNRLLAEMNTSDMSEFVRAAQQMWDLLLDRYNLLSLLRTYPVGVTSLLSSAAPVQTPLGSAPAMEITSIAGFLGLCLLISLLGVAGGSIYFAQIARKLAPAKNPLTIRQMVWEISQMVVLNISAYIILILVAIPTSLMLLLIALINAALAQIAVFFMGLLLIWLMLPLIFSPHGVFAMRQNVLSSMLTSVRLVRLFLPGTGLFILLTLLISQGLDVIWRVPPETSWMTLIGILGHGFVTTALVGASFSYYLGGIRWMEASLSRRAAGGATPSGQQRG